ncbi:MipA/OmpV family protein [Thiomicrorhabdus sp. ZW0627]|uniref:MipA/OmpV family protein n=1 Tax=Thiomicrorhabdus sp. ZW0627 TaxID=3039774 RepID=UPI002436B361|nr:MipA/OmpV family protein [Thiomicrorhabdus sp. ZW0627]MDG6774335.1 MipA/OmpV family protein [Thiomicrorhabdus sp. ZW0627]
MYVFTRILALFLIAGSTSCFAEEQTQNLPKWEFGLGPSLLSYPDYPGSKEQNNLILPFPYITYRGEEFSIEQKEVTKPLFRSGRLTLDLSATGSVPVSSKDNRLREGMDDLDASIGLGPVVSYRLYSHELNDVQFELPVRWVIASDFRSIHEEGWVTDPGIYYYYRQNFTKRQRLKLTFGAAANFGTDRFHDYFYGVSEAEATTTRPAYKAQGGLSGFTYTLGMNWHIDDFWVGGFYRLKDMHNAVYEDSPLMETWRSETFGLVVTWNFYTSKETVKGLE